ncbi:MAG: hypothetical protein GW861_02745 [Deltaproteobacteria bacterium]|nr:hypothetical protein [Deltaproteobacteria bacterium]
MDAVPEGDIEEALTKDNQSREIHEFYGVSPYWEDGQQQGQGSNTPSPMMQDMNKNKKIDNKDPLKTEKK